MISVFMILYCKDSLGCIDNNNIELINNNVSNLYNNSVVEKIYGMAYMFTLHLKDLEISEYKRESKGR
jgi:hypothetical protein